MLFGKKAEGKNGPVKTEEGNLGIPSQKRSFTSAPRGGAPPGFGGPLSSDPFLPPKDWFRRSSSTPKPDQSKAQDMGMPPMGSMRNVTHLPERRARLQQATKPEDLERGSSCLQSSSTPFTNPTRRITQKSAAADPP